MDQVHRPTPPRTPFSFPDIKKQHRPQRERDGSWRLATAREPGRRLGAAGGELVPTTGVGQRAATSRWRARGAEAGRRRGPVGQIGGRPSSWSRSPNPGRGGGGGEAVGEDGAAEGSRRRHGGRPATRKTSDDEDGTSPGGRRRGPIGQAGGAPRRRERGDSGGRRWRGAGRRWLAAQWRSGTAACWRRPGAPGMAPAVAEDDEERRDQIGGEC
uniref:Uncharacterized protein n=1 Tax=Oryza meridionalis TaxID=40149 RepID=A0A0E0DKA7_9ORYZ